jgi:hypothetical protein
MSDTNRFFSLIGHHKVQIQYRVMDNKEAVFICRVFHVFLLVGLLSLDTQKISNSLPIPSDH